MSRLSLTLALTFFASTAIFSISADTESKRKPARRPNPAMLPIKDDPALPRVLLIGDSISIGYTLPVRALLKGNANVHRIPVNGGPTSRGIASIDEWIGDKKWDVIHFNFGLHDLKYVDDKLKAVPPGEGKQQVPLDQYRKNLTAIVDRLEKTGAKLIWRPTTQVPADSAYRIEGSEVDYNNVAAEVISGRGIEVNDLNPLISMRPELQRPANVHFTTEGSQALAEAVVASIQAALSK